MSDPKLYCSCCGEVTAEGITCCPGSHASAAPTWEGLDFPAQALLRFLVRCDGSTTERALDRNMWLSGVERRDAVRDLDPPRGTTNLILRAPYRDQLGSTRLYRVTPAGLAAFANGNQERVDLTLARSTARSIGRHSMK